VECSGNPLGVSGYLIAFAAQFSAWQGVPSPPPVPDPTLSDAK